MSLRVLITGAAGYLGSILVGRLLQAGHSVVALDRMSFVEGALFQYCADENFDFVRGDARDRRIIEPLLSRADVIIPLAALVGANACDVDPDATISINVGAVRALLDLRTPDQLLILPTTVSTYGARAEGELCTEDSPTVPVSLYGRTKLEAEQAVLDAPNTISLRLATVFGMSPRMRTDLLVNYFVYAAMTDGYVVIFEKDFKRDHIHVRDVADCFAHCIRESGRMAGRSYNVGLDSANLSKAELALKVQAVIPNFFIHFADIGSDPDRRNYTVSNDRLRDAGFEASRDLDAGIVELMKGYRMLSTSPLRNA